MKQEVNIIKKITDKKGVWEFSDIIEKGENLSRGRKDNAGTVVIAVN